MESFVMELSSFFRWLLISTMQVSVVVCLILAAKAILHRRLAVRWHYWLWLLLVVRMVCPWAPESNFSVFSLISQVKKTVVTKHVAEVSQLSETAKVMPKTTSLAQGNQSVKDVKTTFQSAQSPAGASMVSFEVIDIFSILWLIIAFGLAVFALVCNFRLWRIIKSQRPLTEGKVLDLLEDCKAQLGIGTILGVVVTDKVKSPALFGVVRPRLLLPEGMLEVLSQEELRFVFLHELGHLKRHDIYLGWLMVFLQVLH
jgi:bla regulator protein BlaR1